MKERDYIVAGDLAKLRVIEAVLRDIVPDDHPTITAEEYKQVVTILRKWRGGLEGIVLNRR